MQPRSIDLKSLKVKYKEYESPSDKTILFLHGGGGFVYTNSELLENLSSTYRVIAIEIPGFGLS